MINSNTVIKKPKLFTLLIVVLFISSLGQVTSDLYLPSLPAMAVALNVDASWIKFTIAIYMIGFCISQLIYGPLSDAIGRKNPVIFGLLLTFIGSIICTLANNIYTLYIGRILQGLGVGAGTALGRAILRDLFENEILAKYNSYLAMSMVIILAIAPVLGGYIEHYAGWRYNFVFLTIYSMTILILFYYIVHETNIHRHPQNFTKTVIIKNTKALLSSHTFLRFAFCPLFTYAGILSWLTAAPIILQERVGLNPVEFGWLYMFSGAGFALGGFINSKYVVKYGIERMMVIGFMIQLLSGILMAGFYYIGYLNSIVIIIPVIIYMLGSSLIFPNSSAGAFGPFAKIAGTAGAIFGFMQILGGAASSSIISIQSDENQLPMAFVFILTAIVGLSIFKILKTQT